VETFDRAKNLREVKLVFSTLAESFGNQVTSTSKPIKESKGSASKAVASTKPKSTPKVIEEGMDLKKRFQKLASRPRQRQCCGRGDVYLDVDWTKFQSRHNLQYLFRTPIQLRGLRRWLALSIVLILTSPSISSIFELLAKRQHQCPHQFAHRTETVLLLLCGWVWGGWGWRRKLGVR